MIDHLAEARRITEGETAYDATALSYGILHALIAIAERMGEPMTEAHWRAMAEAWASASAQVEEVTR